MGDKSRFALSFFDRTAESDSLTELTGALISGYNVEDEKVALEQRYSAAVSLVNARQAEVAVEAAEAGEAIDDYTEEQLTALFTTRDEVITVPGDTWESAIPLLLIATDYAPYTDRVKPVGNVKFVDPLNERTFLGSLSDIGALTLHVREGEAAAA